MDTYIGQQLEQYKIEAHIGAGSSGAVYRATDVNLVRPVVLKLLKPTLTKHPARQQQILKAAQAASRLSHPAIVPFYDFGQQNGHLYLVTALVEGISLERVLGLLALDNRVLRLDETLAIIAQIAEGLGYAHQNGVLHGDLKPGNILIKPLERPLRSGDPALKAMLADFGLSPIPESGVPTGLPPELARPLRRFLPYLAPERQAGQPVDGRADIYSLGVILHQLIAGVHVAPLPHAQQSLRELRPGLPVDIANIAAKAAAHSPADRYPIAEQMGDELRQAASRLTAADMILFAPQATVVDLRTLMAEDKNAAPVRPPLTSLEETAALPPPPEKQSDEEATPALLPPAGLVPRHPGTSQPNALITELHVSPPPDLGDQIVITGQGRSPRHFSMNKPRLTIGRAPDNDIVLSSLDVSRHHARLEKVGGGWRIVDVDSRGGTFNDGHKLDPQKPELWLPGQKLQIGPYFLQWLLAEDSDAVPARQTLEEAITELFPVAVDGSQVQASHSNFSVALTPTQVTLAPGQKANLQIELFNQSSQVLVVKITLTGLPEVATLAQDTVSMIPGSRATVPLTLELPTLAQPLLAGQHPFQLLLHAEGPPVETAVLQGQLIILPEEQFELSIWPAHVAEGGTCRVMVRNDGNVSSTVQLAAQDPAGRLQFFGDEQPLKLEPGGTGTTAYRITHRKKRPLFGRVRQIPFEIEIRSSNGLRQNKLGHVEVRPRFPAWVLPLIQLLMVLLLIAVVLNSVLNNRPDPASNLPATPTGEVDGAGATPTLTIAQLMGDDDNDGLTGEQELALGTDPFNPDTDGDGLLDGDEVNIYGTDPLLMDTDGDGLIDGVEVKQYQTDPTLADTDLDGIPDGVEVAAGTDPLRFDAAGTAVPQTTPADGHDEEHDLGLPTAVSTPVSPPITAPTGETTVQIPLTAASSGWLGSDGTVNLGPAELPRAGDMADGTAVRALLTFSLADLPSNALIRTAFLRFSSDAAVESDPFAALGCLQVELAEVNLPPDNTAYDAPGFFISCETSAPSSIAVAIDVEDALALGQTQLILRLGFETESNGDAVANLYTMRTVPTLEVSYLLP